MIGPYDRYKRSDFTPINCQKETGLTGGNQGYMNITPTSKLIGGFNPLKYISQNGNLPQVGMNIKNI